MMVMDSTYTPINTHYHTDLPIPAEMPCYLEHGIWAKTTYTVTVACQLIPVSQFPSRSLWSHPVFTIEEEASWIGYGRASMAAMAMAQAKYGERMVAETSFVMEITPLPA